MTYDEMMPPIKPKPKNISLHPLGRPFVGSPKAAESRQPKMTDEAFQLALLPPREAWRARIKSRMLGEKGGAMSGS